MFYSTNFRLLILTIIYVRAEQEVGESGSWEIPLAEFESIVKSGSALIVDVREPSEVAEVRVDAKKYVNIPLDQVELALQLSPDKFQETYDVSKPERNEEIVFICRSGRRSEASLRQARNLNYLTSRHFQGGTLRWVEEHPDQVVQDNGMKQKHEL